MNRGYIKVWRKLEDSGLLQMPNTLALFMFILMHATHKPIKVGTKTGVVHLERGQYISGRSRLSEQMEQGEQQIRTSLRRLEEMEILTIKSTSKYSVYTVVNYDIYQDNDQPSTSKLTNNQPAINQQLTTKQECKELKEHKGGASKESPTTRAITFKEWLEAVKAKGEKQISDYKPVWEYAEQVGIPDDWVRIAWIKFDERYRTDEKASKKKYINWRQHFLNAIKENWFHLWYSRDGKFELTTAGVQADLSTREAA